MKKDSTFSSIDMDQELLRRRDMRSVFTFTIDPDTAKDFDDALSYQDLGEGLYQVGVHIADVSYFVPSGSKLDKEAYERGNSIYLVDRVIPMLPEELSNDMCSLMPNEDRLCMSVVFVLNAEGKVEKYKICRTVIHSDYRLDYDQAQRIIDASAVEQVSDIADAALWGAIHQLHVFAEQMRSRRMREGSLDIEQEEVRFRLDAQGHPTDIWFEEPTPSHHLIEEFMLLANRTVATHIGKLPFIFRVHDKPNEEKLTALKSFQNFLRRSEDEQTIHRVTDILAVRAMAKAVYSTVNIGHYGLHFACYTHFTSPIRRYPDLVVHRLVSQYVLKGKKASLPLDELQQIADHCSSTELYAQEAERESVKTYQTLWMADHLGQVFTGRIVSVMDFGIFVRLDGNCCEGLVHVNQLVKNDYMVYDEKHFRLIGERTGKTFMLGDALMVKVIKADVMKNQIDFQLCESEDKV